MVKKAEKIAQAARLACEKWRTNFKHNINQYHEMHSFVLGDQWSDDEEGEMIKTYRKVPLTSNKLGAMSNALLGEQQQNTPQLEVIPMSNCDEEVAHLRELITKDIILSREAATVYQVAASQAFIGGFGAFCWGTKYVYSSSFDQDIAAHYFKDASRAYFDIGAEEINKTDGMYAGYVSYMTRRKFRELYGQHIEEKVLTDNQVSASQEEIALAVDPQSESTGFAWATDDTITINDYYVRIPKNTTLYKLSNGNTYTQEELDKLIEKSRIINQEIADQEMNTASLMGPTPEAMAESDVEATATPEDESSEIMTIWDGMQPVRIEDKRQITKYRIKHYQIAGDYILDETWFPSEKLPVIFVDNNSYYDKHGKQMCRSFFGDAKDTQRYINYLRTQSAYILKVSRYDMFMGSKKNVASNDTAAKWKDPQNVQGLLTYDESPTGIRPEQIRPPELSASLLSQYQLAVEDLYTCTGLYPTRMGQTGGEISGAAIDARTRQGSFSTFVAFNSINRAIAAGGEIVNQMIPEVYDTERVLTLMFPEEGMRNITINRQLDEFGAKIENDIRKGTYQIKLKPGASYEGQKEQALISLKEVITANPGAFTLIADLYAENLPLSNTLEIKNRLKTLVPPEIIEAGKTGRPIPPKPQQPSPEEQLIQVEMQRVQMDAQNKMRELEIKQAELQLKAQKQEVELQIEMEKLRTERLEVAADLEQQSLRFQAETNRTQTDAAIAHANNLARILTKGE